MRIKTKGWYFISSPRMRRREMDPNDVTSCLPWGNFSFILFIFSFFSIIYLFIRLNSRSSFPLTWLAVVLRPIRQRIRLVTTKLFSAILQRNVRLVGEALMLSSYHFCDGLRAQAFRFPTVSAELLGSNCTVSCVSTSCEFVESCLS